MKIGLGLVAIVVLLYGATWMASTGGDFDNASAEEVATPTTSTWMAPTFEAQTSTPPALPDGFPYMEFPPPMEEAPDGQPQDVPTKFGVTYTVPGDDEWNASNGGIANVSGDDTRIIYGAMSEYREGYCPDRSGAALTDVGMTGRNGVDIDTAAREAVEEAELVFADEAGSSTDIDIRGPFHMQVSGNPAVRYTAVATGLEQGYECDPREATFDIVATQGYATAEVVTFMVLNNRGSPNSLSDEDVDGIIGSLRKTK